MALEVLHEEAKPERRKVSRAKTKVKLFGGLLNDKVIIIIIIISSSSSSLLQGGSWVKSFCMPSFPESNRQS